MKKNSILLICAMLLSACSMTVGQFFGAPPTPIPSPTFTNTPTDKPTFTPTVPTPTYTLTPTLVGLKTKTTTPDFTPTQLLLTPLDVTMLPSATLRSHLLHKCQWKDLSQLLFLKNIL